MVNPRQTLGIVEVTVNGKALNIVPGTATLDFGGPRRKTQRGDRGANFSVEKVEAAVECEVYFDPATRLAEYNKQESVTVVARCDTGQVYTLAQAWLEGEIQPKAGDGGKHKLRYVADQAQEAGGA